MLDRESLPVIDMKVADHWSRPHEYLAGLRSQSPVARDANGGLWFLSHELVSALIHDKQFISPDRAALYGNTRPAITEWYQHQMVSKNGPEHARLRRLVSRAFTPASVEKLRVAAREIVGDLLDTAVQTRDSDVLGELPGRLMCRLLGISEDDRVRFMDWVDALGEFFGFGAGDSEMADRIESAIVNLHAYLSEHIDSGRARASSELITTIAEASEGDRLSKEETVTMVSNLLFAGTDSVRNTVQSFLVLLARHHDQFTLLQREPSLIPAAAEELLRFEPTAFITSRAASESTEFHGLPLDEGEVLIANLVSAERDPARWLNPNQLDVRRNPARTIDYGAGPHMCLGAGLARMELQELLHVLTTRTRSIHLESEPTWTPFLSLRRLQDVSVSFDIS